MQFQRAFNEPLRGKAMLSEWGKSFKKRLEKREQNLLPISDSLQNSATLLRRLALLAEPPKLQPPDKWADENIVMPKGSPRPGQWDSNTAPYMIEIGRAQLDPRYRTIASVTGSQSGKTRSCFNLMAWRSDIYPSPQMYVGPTQSFVDSRCKEILATYQSCERLWKNTVKGQASKKYEIESNTQPVHLSWAGSESKISGVPSRFVYVDELDRMINTQGGDVLGVIYARMQAYEDAKLSATSTPLDGNIETFTHPDTGIEHWAVAKPEDVTSRIWRLWQRGTRQEWAVQCFNCKAHFIPRFKLMGWSDDKSLEPYERSRTAYLRCFHCGHEHTDIHKEDLNRSGVYLGPGQDVVNGKVVGELRKTNIASFWVSGVMAAFSTFEDRVLQWLLAVESHDQDEIKGAITLQFGECFAFTGAAPDHQKIMGLIKHADHARGELPAGVNRIFCTVDVQHQGLYVVIRGWGYGLTSWLIDERYLTGDTSQPEVWQKLTDIMDSPIGKGRRMINEVAVDGGDGERMEHVFNWCRKRGSQALVVMGVNSNKASKLYWKSKNEQKKSGKWRKGAEHWNVSSGDLKQMVYNRLEYDPEQDGAWFPHAEITEDYARQVVSESPIRLPSGRVMWKKIRKDNHYLDCEAYQFFLAMLFREKINIRAEKPSNGGRYKRRKSSTLD